MMAPPGDLLSRLLAGDLPIAVIGLGYVGLPLAVCLAKAFRVIGFDIDDQRLTGLRAGADVNGEIQSSALAASRITFSGDAAILGQAGFIVVAVPTPIDRNKRPDLTPLSAASITVGQHIRPGSVVVFESTVYPGLTEEICIPLIERASGLRGGRDFSYGYSPERINPGDREHTIDRITKVVSACDADTLRIVGGVYGAVIPAGVFRATSIKVAEAAKVIENTQRDLNIALVNELALICHRLGIDTAEVLEAASTKWNFLPFRPGLVGGHCIGVDPYYLTHKAIDAGHHPEVILAGRRINDSMGSFIVQECIRLMLLAKRLEKGATVLILGLSFKENCRDVRNSGAVDIIIGLRRFGLLPVVCDPVADTTSGNLSLEVGMATLETLPPCAAIIAAVPHEVFLQVPIDLYAAAAGPGAPFLDVRSAWNASAIADAGFTSWRL
jgi:UDP-N-acetyl-D-glucosamine/UDP-N-acetyl-D-galactosamine dehydrogenase